MEWGLDRRTEEHIFSTSGCFSFYGQKNRRTCFFNEWMFSFYGQKNRRTCFSTSGCFSFYGQKNKRTCFFNEWMFFFLWTEEQKDMFFQRGDVFLFMDRRTEGHIFVHSSLFFNLLFFCSSVQNSKSTPCAYTPGTSFLSQSARRRN